MDDSNKDGFEIDDILETLSNEYRREILYLLDESRDSFSSEEIVDYLDSTFDEDRDRIETSVHHNHLPRMDRKGIIDYEKSLDMVIYNNNQKLSRILKVLRDID